MSDKTKDALKGLLDSVTDEKTTPSAADKSKKKKDPLVDLVDEPTPPPQEATVTVISEDLQKELVENTVEVVRAELQDTLDAAIQNALAGAKEAGTLSELAVVDDSEEVPVRQHGTQSREAKPHAFVVMPFGTKYGSEGQVYNFNAIYQDLIKPALIEAGFEPFRADDETATGDILTDMFQELLLADLAICDLSIDNANVFYELGIRHAFRKRGVVHIQSGRAYMPFDIFNVRTIPYHTGEDGLPDPEFLEKDIQTIARTCRDTWASDRDAIHSPVTTNGASV